MKKMHGIVSEIVPVKAPKAKAPILYLAHKAAKPQQEVYGYQYGMYSPPITQIVAKKKRNWLPVTILAFFLLISVALGVMWMERSGLEEGKDYTMVKYNVDRGDTLWGIVREVNNNIEQYDIRNFIYIMEADERNVDAFTETNSGKILNAGSTIYVPQGIHD